jgi:hypothetical protein
VVLLEGRIGLKMDDQVLPGAKAGDILLFKAGSTVDWTIHEKVRKVAFVHRPSRSHAYVHAAKQLVKRLIGRVGVLLLLLLGSMWALAFAGERTFNDAKVASGAGPLTGEPTRRSMIRMAWHDGNPGAGASGTRIRIPPPHPMR